MDGPTTMNRLAEVIDAHAWNELLNLLHEDFVCSYVHTGERFVRGTWVRSNAHYPGSERFVLQDSIGSAARAAGRSHVTGHVGDTLQHFEVATFITLRAGRISEMTEVWTDVNEQAPERKRPASLAEVAGSVRDGCSEPEPQQIIRGTSPTVNLGARAGG